MLDLAPGFGVHPGEKRIDGRAVMERVRRERDRFVGFVLESVESFPESDRIRGHARFTGPHTLQIDEHTEIEAARIVIATGSSPVILPQLKEVGPGIVTSDDVFYWDDLPASVAVIGSGVIGLELGQALSRLGVKVSIFARGGSVAQLSDPEVLHAATRTLSAELDLRFQTEVVRAVQQGEQGVLLTTRDALGKETSEQFQYVLLATGRTPNVHGLGLEETGLTLMPNGVPEFDSRTMQCGTSHIFIAGDANNELPLLAEAADHGKIAGENAGRYPDVRPGLRRTPLGIAFTEPNIATLGKSYKTLCEGGRPKFAIGQVSFENQGRSRVMLQNKGMLRVYGLARSGGEPGQGDESYRCGGFGAGDLGWAPRAHAERRVLLADHGRAFRSP
jgi:dihydrolipoamide dehydrogenase